MGNYMGYKFFFSMALSFSIASIFSVVNAAEPYRPLAQWYIRGGYPIYEDLRDRKNNLPLGLNYAEWLNNQGITNYDSIPVKYPMNPLHTLEHFDKNAFDKGWMSSTRFMLCVPASELFDRLNMTESDWRKSIFSWHVDITEKEWPADMCRYFGAARLKYLPDLYHELPLDGTYSFNLAKLGTIKGQSAGSEKHLVYGMFLVDPKNTIVGFKLFTTSYATKNNTVS